MLFNSIQYVYFLPVVVFLYFLLSPKFRWILLLAASYYFYMCWNAAYVFLILGSTLVDYISGLMMEKQNSRRRKTPFLLLSLAANLGLLFSFKYFNFFANSLNLVFAHYNLATEIPFLNILLPVGISFYTFQTLSYSIEVYLGRQKAEKHLGYFALYVSFFPQLVAGPIERYSRLAPQFRLNHKLSYDNLTNGLRLILYGLFVKMVIADNLSIYVDQVYEAVDHYSSADILLAMCLYSFQIYCDFHGYSTIAIGSALIMGIRIMDNFKTPYMARSIGEFWQRWHISLSTWFRDYLYLPLGGNKVAKRRWILNILIVFIVSGLWHGANWTFVFWGGLFGFIYLIEKGIHKTMGNRSTKDPFSWKHTAYVILTFTLVTMIWVFFRSPSIQEAFLFFNSLARNGNSAEQFLEIQWEHWLAFGIFLFSDLWLYNSRIDKRLKQSGTIIRWIIYGVLIFMIIVFTAVENQPFIYFQF